MDLLIPIERQGIRKGANNHWSLPFGNWV